MSSFRQKHLNKNTKPQSPGRAMTLGIPSVPLEHIHNQFPSLHALANLHCKGFFHLPLYEAISQSPLWPLWGDELHKEKMRTKAAQIIPWLDQPRQSVFRGVARGARVKTSDIQRSCVCKTQIAIAFSNQRMRRAWEMLSKSGLTVSSQTLLAHQVGTTTRALTMPIAPTQSSQSPRRSMPKSGKSLQGDWSF